MVNMTELKFNDNEAMLHPQVDIDKEDLKSSTLVGTNDSVCQSPIPKVVPWFVSEDLATQGLVSTITDDHKPIHVCNETAIDLSLRLLSGIAAHNQRNSLPGIQVEVFHVSRRLCCVSSPRISLRSQSDCTSNRALCREKASVPAPSDPLLENGNAKSSDPDSICPSLKTPSAPVILDCVEQSFSKPTQTDSESSGGGDTEGEQRVQAAAEEDEEANSFSIAEPRPELKYESLEITLAEFEESVASIPNVSSADQSLVGDDGDVLNEHFDEPGLLDAVERVLDCTDINSDMDEQLSPADITFDEFCIGEYELEESQQEYGISWICPCCDEADEGGEYIGLSSEDLSNSSFDETLNTSFEAVEEIHSLSDDMAIKGRNSTFQTQCESSIGN